SIVLLAICSGFYTQLSAIMASKTTFINEAPGGGQFAPEKGGQVRPEKGGQVRPERGGQFERIFHME
ncbi:MAG: hypothetical protein J0M10_16525, partial [Chitinophagales bacterium]|nr:hypothetical protein [Chitinophagales bacterium]